MINLEARATYTLSGTKDNGINKITLHEGLTQASDTNYNRMAGNGQHPPYTKTTTYPFTLYASASHADSNLV